MAGSTLWFLRRNHTWLTTKRCLATRNTSEVPPRSRAPPPQLQTPRHHPRWKNQSITPLPVGLKPWSVTTFSLYVRASVDTLIIFYCCFLSSDPVAFCPITGNEPNMLAFHMWPWFERIPYMDVLLLLDVLPRLHQWTLSMREVDAVQALGSRSHRLALSWNCTCVCVWLWYLTPSLNPALWNHQYVIRGVQSCDFLGL